MGIRTGTCGRRQRQTGLSEGAGAGGVRPDGFPLAAAAAASHERSPDNCDDSDVSKEERRATAAAPVIGKPSPLQYFVRPRWQMEAEV